jgi:hypothetical protein
MRKINQKETRTVVAEGFRDGTQGVNPGPAQEEINALFARQKEQDNHDATERIKKLEGQVEQLERRKLDAERHWADLEILTGGMPPQIVLPLTAVLLSALVVVGESVFLAPVMDGFGIADLMWQYLLAAVIVITCSGLIEITKREWLQTRVDRDSNKSAGPHAEQTKSVHWGRRVFFAFMALLALLLVSILGWWRAEEMMFAASAQSGEWQDFLSQNATLTRCVVILLTTGLPVFVALAFEWGLDGLRLAWEWRKSRRDYRKTSATLERTRKDLEGEFEKKNSRQKALDELREEWKQAYLQNHELGRRVGARRLPLWRVILKIGAVVFVIVMICLLADPLVSGYILSDFTRLLLYTCVTIGLGGLYAAHAIKAWDRPNARQLYKQQATLWRSDGDGSLPSSSAKAQTDYPSDNGRRPLHESAGSGRMLSAK